MTFELREPIVRDLALAARPKAGVTYILSRGGETRLWGLTFTLICLAGRAQLRGSDRKLPTRRRELSGRRTGGNLC